MKQYAIIILLGLSLISCNKEKDYLITIHTRVGDIKAILYDETPLHKENFLALAKSGRFDSTIFHRVIKGFMIQGGDIDAKEGTRNSERIAAEFVEKYHHKKGAIAAARQGAGNPEMKSSWCQFYIVQGNKFTEKQLLDQALDQQALNRAFPQLLQYESQAELSKRYTELYQKGDREGMNQLIRENIGLAEEVTGIKIRRPVTRQQIEDYTTVGGAPHLDGTYTVFGEVISGLEVVDQIAELRVAGRSKPIEDVFMTVEIEEMKRAKITKEYGYEYPEE